MLPSSKRSRNHDEVIRTGDFEVVQNDADEERTLLFKGSHKSMLPPKSAEAMATPSMKAPRAPNMNLRGLVRAGQEPPRKMEMTNLRGAVRPRMETEDRTVLRPMSTLPPAMLQKPASVAPPSPRPAAGVRPAMMPTPYMPMKPGMVGSSVAPVAIPVNAHGGTDRKSDPPGDPPSSVITAKTRIVRARASMSWAVGLMAVGAVVGLVTAVIARGDADSLIDATATLVDPSHAPAHAGGAAAQAAVLPAFLEPSSPKAGDKNASLDVGEATVSAPVVLSGPEKPEKAESKKTAMLTGADPSAAAKPVPPRAAPVAYAAPVRPHPAPAPAAPQPANASGSSGWLANVTPAGAGAPIGRPSKSAKGSSGGGEFENAAAADALAKAQLEASLR
ncbi:MAG TPA: hypothetical protein VMI75_26795 [Polyangiaceae bacterium]|nr:hypothetical protein [Polyangiaceae bacterium]